MIAYQALGSSFKSDPIQLTPKQKHPVTHKKKLAETMDPREKTKHILLNKLQYTRHQKFPILNWVPLC